MVIYPSSGASLTRLGFNTNNSSSVAVLVHPPEHYDRFGEHLVGSQAMRVRQLTAMGFRVMSSNMSQVNRLVMHPDKLRDHLQELYKKVITAKFPPLTCSSYQMPYEFNMLVRMIL